MILTYKVDLDILKMYLLTKNKVSRSRLSTARARTGQTDTRTDETGRINTAAFAGGNNNNSHVAVPSAVDHMQNAIWCHVV